MIAAAQWVLPQVDIYVGELSPFGASLNFTDGSSRSNASGKRIYRHSKPNGGPTFGVVDESSGDEDPNHVERDEVQVRVGLSEPCHDSRRQREKTSSTSNPANAFNKILEEQQGKKTT